MDEITPFRRVAATLTIGSFSIAALMGIAALLAGGSFGETEGRILLTTLVVGCASICALCYLGTAGTRWVAVGVAGAVVLVLPVVTSLILVWGDWDGDPEALFKLFGIGVVLALTLAQVSLLLALAGARDEVGFVGWITVALASVVALLITGLILGEVDVDGVWRLLGVLAILDVLGTLITIATAKFGVRRQPAGGARSFPVAAHQAAALDALARTTGRPVADLVSDAVDDYLRAHPAERVGS